MAGRAQLFLGNVQGELIRGTLEGSKEKKMGWLGRKKEKFPHSI